MKLGFHPLQFFDDVVDDVSGLQMLGQHIPGVGFDLELGRQRIGSVEGESLFDRRPCRFERPEIFEEHRHMEWVRHSHATGPPSNFRTQPADPRVFARPAAHLDRLMQIDRIIELAKGLYGVTRYLGNAHGPAACNFITEYRLGAAPSATA